MRFLVRWHLLSTSVVVNATIRLCIHQLCLMTCLASPRHTSRKQLSDFDTSAASSATAALIVEPLPRRVFVWSTLWLALPPVNWPSGVDCRARWYKKKKFDNVAKKKVRRERGLFFSYQFFKRRLWGSLKELSFYFIFQRGRANVPLPRIAPIGTFYHTIYSVRVCVSRYVLHLGYDSSRRRNEV